jgi:hypothetical protein
MVTKIKLQNLLKWGNNKIILKKLKKKLVINSFKNKTQNHKYKINKKNEIF